MSRQRATFGKLQRERDKQAKAKAKRERRLTSGADAGGEDHPNSAAKGPEDSPDAVMEKVAELHRRFEGAELDLDDYEEQKAALLSRLVIE